MWAVRLADQQTVWDYRQPQQLVTSALTPTGRGIVLASVEPGDVGAQTPGQVALFDTGDSTPRWTRTFPQLKAGLQNPMGRFVCVAGGRVLYISDKPAGLDLATGRDAWQFSRHEARPIDWSEFTVGPDGKTVFIKCLGRFYAIDAASGRVVWEASGEYFGFTSIVADGNLYLTDQGNRTLWAVDPATGKARWKHVLPPPVKHEPKTGLRMGGSGELMLAAGGGQVYFADPDAKAVTALRATGR